MIGSAKRRASIEVDYRRDSLDGSRGRRICRKRRDKVVVERAEVNAQTSSVLTRGMNRDACRSACEAIFFAVSDTEKGVPRSKKRS